MNYLAHLFLSENTPEARIGNLMGDFVKLATLDPEIYPAPMRRGIVLHHRIDTYTDTHPIFQTSRQRISAAQRRYAGILIDIFYDHFLAFNWSQFSSQPLPDFAQSIYSALRSYDAILPDALQQIVPGMIQDDWLTAYQDLSGIQRALERVSQRIKHENDIAFAITELGRNYDALEADFFAFFPDLSTYVHSQIEAMQSMAREIARLGVSSDPEQRKLEFLLGHLAGDWRGARDNPQKRPEIVAEYQRILLHLYSLGWDKMLHPEAQLPDEYMPEAFFEHNPECRL